MDFIAIVVSSLKIYWFEKVVIYEINVFHTLGLLNFLRGRVWESSPTVMLGPGLKLNIFLKDITL